MKIVVLVLNIVICLFIYLHMGRNLTLSWVYVECVTVSNLNANIRRF